MKRAEWAGDVYRGMSITPCCKAYNLTRGPEKVSTDANAIRNGWQCTIVSISNIYQLSFGINHWSDDIGCVLWVYIGAASTFS